MVSDVQRPNDDPYALVGGNWPTESEGAYHAAETNADTLSTTARTQAESADAAAGKTDSQMRGKTADSVSDGYSRAAKQLNEQGQNYTTISAWMVDAASKVRTAKNRMVALVRAGTSEIKDALVSELAGTPVTPSSSALTDKYRGEIASIASTLGTDLDGIGHSLVGDPGASHTPTYVRAAASPTAPSIEQAAVHHGITGEGPHVEPHQLPEMPRAATPSVTESSSAPSAPTESSAAPHSTNPTLANLISGSGASSGNTTSPSGGGASHGSSSGTTPAAQGAQAPERHQERHAPHMPQIPSVVLPDLPAAAQAVSTAVSAASGTQLPVTTAAPTTPTVPASTGFTPGTSGTFPMTAGGLSPIGGGLPTAPVTQAPPAVQGTPATPAPGVQAPSAPQQSPPSAAPPRGPLADMAWIQRNYGLAPGIELSKPENTSIPALFVASLPEPEAHLHKILATLRHAFDDAGWGQPMAVGLIKRGLEHRTVYVTADGLSLHPHGVLLPHGVTQLDEMPSVPSAPEMAGSLMVIDKLKALIPRGWQVETVLSTVPADENHQSTEQYRELVESEELLPCKVSRGRVGVTAEEAMAVFARAALGSGGCGDLDSESARLRGSRWLGVQPSGYVAVLSRWYLADAAESMSEGAWGDAVYCSEKYLGLMETKRQVA